jgi:hypothetical protein
MLQRPSLLLDCALELETESSEVKEKEVPRAEKTDLI